MVVWRGADLFSVHQLARELLRRMDQRRETLRADPEIMSGVPECQQWSILFGALATDAAKFGR